MARRGYKLQEFVAHAGNVNCLSFGKKNCKVFITGGDDQKVNLWSYGRPTPLTSLSGHTSPIESASFDPTEALVVAGSSSGAIKLWDLEETKMVRTLSGHRSYCTAVGFHPFGEFLASGSMDTNLKIWDIRKKGCIHTYKGHTRGISTIRFSPDGRWVVSGGFDNVVKAWDLTAGKLLHEFKFHEGHIRSIEFHPLEFLLATGSADKTVKFWDLETFEMIGSTSREATGLRSMAFHPDGRTLFCGLDDSLKVYSWEPVMCHDSVDMGWSTLGDLCVHDGKLLGGAYYENMVAVWVADISVIEPYGTKSSPEQHGHLEKKCDNKGRFLDEEIPVKSSSNLQPMVVDSDSKGIKTIYVDRVNSITSKAVHHVDVPEIEYPSISKETSISKIQKHVTTPRLPAKSVLPPASRSAVMSTAATHDGMSGNSSVESRRDSISSAKASFASSTKPPHTRRSSGGRFDVGMTQSPLESMDCDKTKAPLPTKKVTYVDNRSSATEDAKKSTEDAKKSTEDKQSNSNTILEKLDRTLSPAAAASPSLAALMPGRTRSLVERFERKETLDVDEVCNLDRASITSTEPLQTPTLPQISDQQIVRSEEPKVDDSTTECTMLTLDDNATIESMMLDHDVLLSTFRSRLTKLQVLWHFFERNDVKGAIEAMRKLPDHSVQADVVGILVHKMEIITLDLFSCLLPVLEGLTTSKVDRHVTASLEMLMKLVAVFGTVIRSTLSASPPVGVNLHAEERLECCKQCMIHLQNIQKVLPGLLKRGGDVGRFAQQLSLVLEQT